jgi:hypothetical protein
MNLERKGGEYFFYTIVKKAFNEIQGVECKAID